MGNYKSVTSEYRSGTPIKEIARKLGLSEVKVRRILITEGLWASRTSQEVLALHGRGLSVVEIAEKLMKPVKTVQAYMPYIRGEYGTEEVSESARNNRVYRERNRKLAARQVNRGKDETKGKDKDMGKDMNKDIMNVDEYRDKADTIKEERRMKEERLMKNECRIKDDRRIMKLHLELAFDMDDEMENVLKKYGRCERGISRDILVPGEMPLHNLNYAIQKVFGWQNSHLHSFSYPKEVFEEITTGFMDDWLDLCGVYFRFPQNELDGYFWDDDYDGRMTFRTWLKKKYTGPYFYGGEVEHYMFAQKQAQLFRQKNPFMRLGPTFSEFVAGKSEEKIKNLEEVTIEDVAMYFESGMDELLERLPVEQVLGMTVPEDWAEMADEIVDSCSDDFAELYEYEEKLCRDTQPARLAKKLKEFYTDTDPVVTPLSDVLTYFYDYGDSWEVEITCTGVYSADDSSSWGDLSEEIEKVILEYKPVCIATDGLPVMDDVGGIYGYCEFLRGHRGKGRGLYADKDETREWGRMQGWTGKMSRPANML